MPPSLVQRREPPCNHKGTGGHNDSWQWNVHAARPSHHFAVLRLACQPTRCASQGKVTPLHTAARHGHRTCARALLRAGASVNARTANGYTALGLAASNGHVGLLELLREEGAALNYTTVHQLSALRTAAHNNRARCTAALLAAGAGASWSHTRVRVRVRVCMCTRDSGTHSALLSLRAPGRD